MLRAGGIPSAAPQAEWLARVLAEREGVAHVFPVYHVPAYRSVRRFEGATSELIRRQWVPLFERHGVEVAFENHDHVYKRSIPLLGDERHPDGVVYVGDGAWGAGPREVGCDHGGDEVWYIERA